MARSTHSKIDERLDQHRRADARLKWESAVKATDYEYASAASDPADAISERFNTLERSISLLRRENLTQEAALLRHRRQTRVQLVAAMFVAAVFGATFPRIMALFARTSIVAVTARR